MRHVTESPRASGLSLRSRYLRASIGARAFGLLTMVALAAPCAGDG